MKPGNCRSPGDRRECKSFFATFRICPCCLHSTSGCFKLFQASSDHAHDVKLSKQVYDSARMDILDATLSSFKLSKMHENASSSLYRAWHFTIKFHAAWGYGGEGTRRETSHAEWPHSHCVIMSNQWTQANQNKHLVYFVWTCQSEDCENMQWAHETV